MCVVVITRTPDSHSAQLPGRRQQRKAWRAKSGPRSIFVIKALWAHSHTRSFTNGLQQLSRYDSVEYLQQKPSGPQSFKIFAVSPSTESFLIPAPESQYWRTSFQIFLAIHLLPNHAFEVEKGSNLKIFVFFFLWGGSREGGRRATPGQITGFIFRDQFWWAWEMI